MDAEVEIIKILSAGGNKHYEVSIFFIGKVPPQGTDAFKDCIFLKNIIRSMRKHVG